MPEPLDIVIVGAGLSGLAAAIQTALSGHSVTVLEGAKELAEVLKKYSFFPVYYPDFYRLELAFNSRPTQHDCYKHGASTKRSNTKSASQSHSRYTTTEARYLRTRTILTRISDGNMAHPSLTVIVWIFNKRLSSERKSWAYMSFSTPKSEP